MYAFSDAQLGNITCNINITSGGEEYPYEIDNEIVQYKSRQLLKVNPKYKIFKGWEQSLSQCQKYSELPKEAREFLEFIEDYTKVKISLISNGPQRNDLIHR